MLLLYGYRWATIAGGLIAVSIASWLAYRVFAKYLHHMVSLSVGITVVGGAAAPAARGVLKRRTPTRGPCSR